MAKEVIGKAQFEEEVLRSGVPVLVDFWATWCGPCRAIAGDVNELAETVTGAKVVKVDVDRNQDLAAEHRIGSIPSLVFFRDGREVLRHVGIRRKEALRADLEVLKR